MKLLLETRKEERLFRSPKISIDDLKMKYEKYNMTDDLEILVLSNLVTVVDDERESYNIKVPKSLFEDFVVKDN